MPSLANFNSLAIKCLNVGRPGSGKTGSLISILVDDPEARLFILNYDRANIGTLASVARVDPKTNTPRPPDVVSRILTSQVFYHNLQDKLQSVNGVMMVTGTPTAFSDAGRKLNDWGDGLGGLNTWGPKDWLILDSVSAMGESAMRASTFAMGRLNKRPEQSDWGDAISRLSMLLEMTNDPDIACNIMAITHVRFVGDKESGTDDKGQAKELDMVPNALGQKLPQEIGRFFNNIIETRVVGEGPGTRRAIFTRPPGGLVLRSSNPGGVKPEYPLDTGMAQWVRDIRSAPIVTAPAYTPPAPSTPTADGPPTAPTKEVA